MAVIQVNYFLISVDHKICKISFDGEVRAYVGVDQKGTKPLQFNFPCGVSVSPLTGHIYVTDTFNDEVQILDPDLKFFYELNREESITFREPYDIAFDNEGFLYITDTWNSCIKKFTSNGKFFAKFGSMGTGPGHLCFPESFSIADNNLMYITEHHNHRFSVFTTDSKYLQKMGKKGKGEGQFDWPHGIAFSNLRSLLYTTLIID